MTRRVFTLLIVLACTWPCACASDQPAGPPQVVDTQPRSLPTSGTDLTRDEAFVQMLGSYARVGPLHTISLWGDFQQLIDIQHWGIMLELDRRESSSPPNRHGCSMFQSKSGHTALLGRNFDHKFSEMLVAWCYPDSGYASLGFIPLNQWGFTEDRPFDPEDPDQRRLLLGGPAATIEGMNERGVTVTLASLEPQSVTPDPTKPPRFLIHLVREILDHAGTLEEAIDLARGYNIFDNGRDLISHHIFLADPVSGSAVLEWRGGQMEVLRSGNEDQVVTNRPLCGVEEEDRRRGCRRYRKLAEALEKQEPGFGWIAGMGALQAAAQHNVTYLIHGERWRVSTQWSAVFDMTAREVFVSWGRQYETVYKFQVPTRD